MSSTASYPSESNFLFFWQLKTQKNAWPKSWELRFVWGPYWGLKPRKAASEIALRDLFQRGLRGESGSIGVFAEIKKVVEHQKITANHTYTHTHTHTHTHNRLLKLISMLFCVWKEARVWAHWDYSFNKHLNYQGQYLILLHPESPAPSEQLWWLMAFGLQHPLFTDMAGDPLCPHFLEGSWSL